MPDSKRPPTRAHGQEESARIALFKSLKVLADKLIEAVDIMLEEERAR